MSSARDDVEELVARVLAGENPCGWGCDPETGRPEGEAELCPAPATHQVRGPHGENAGEYCALHAERTRAENVADPAAHRVVPRPSLRGPLELIARVRELATEADRNRKLRRELTQALVEEFGAPGPLSLEKAVARAAARGRELRECVRGWSDPPTDAEIAAHLQGKPSRDPGAPRRSWLVTFEREGRPRIRESLRTCLALASAQRASGARGRWIALDERGCPCPVPQVPSAPAAP